jgi:hypothetical protein
MFLRDLEQSWILYKLQELVFIVTLHIDDNLRQKATTNMIHLIIEHHPRRVWLFVKHQRWMLSDEYAILREKYGDRACTPLFAAKSSALFRPELEDEVAISE